MGGDPHAEVAPASHDLPGEGEFLGGAGRVTAGLVAIVMGSLAGLILRLVHKFLDDVGWFTLAVRLIFDELALTALLFSITLLIWALFAPAWLYRPLGIAYRKLNLLATWMAYLFCSVMGTFLLLGLFILIHSWLVGMLRQIGILR